MTSRSRVTALVAALVLVGLALLLWLRRSPGQREPTHATATGEAEPGSAPRWVIVPPPEVAKLEGGKPADRSRVGLWMLEDPNLPMAVANTLILSRFPRDSIPLKRNMTDVLTPNQRNDTRMPIVRKDGSMDPSIKVLFTGDKYRLLGDQVLNATLEVLKSEQHIPVNVLAARARAVDWDTRRPVGIEAPLVFLDQGGLIYGTTFTATGTPLANYFGMMHLEVEFDAGDGKPSIATLEVPYQPASRSPGHFTGVFREELHEGSLVIYAGVEISEPGFFIIDGNVFDSRNEPTAMVVARVDLQRGPAEVALTVFGRVVREGEAQTPLALTNLRGYRFLEGQSPDRDVMPDFPEDYKTQRYPLTAFSDAEYWDNQKDSMVKNMIRDSQTAHKTMLSQTIGEASARGWRPTW